MTDVTCPTCGYLVPGGADFCPNCGRPRTAMQQRIEDEARETGVPYIQILERARAEAGISVPTNETLRQIQAQLRQMDELVRSLDRRLRQIEEGSSDVDVARPLPEEAGRVEPQRPVQPAPPAARKPAPSPPLRPPLESEQEPAPRPLGAARSEATAKRESPTPSLHGDPQPATQIDLEDLLSGRVLAWTGGAAILIGAIFFLSLAFSRGWIGPAARVVIGVTAAAAMIAAGAWFFERRERTFGHVLVAVGLGVMNVSLFAATRLYDLIPVQPALVGVLGSAVIAAMIAIRASSQIVAIYGLVAALVAPPLLGADPSLGAAVFVGVILLGTTIIALYRTWSWLPPVAFILSTPQVADLLGGDINTALGLAVLTGFWVLHAVSAGGEEFRVRRKRLGVTSATLLLLNALFLVAMGFDLLVDDAERWRGLFLVAVAAAHGLLGSYFLRERGDRHPFGMLAFGTGVAALSMAIPIQLGGAPVPVGWAAEAAALAWVYSRRRHIYAGGYAIVLGALAVAHLLVFEYPIRRLNDDIDSVWPFLNANGATLAFLLGSLAVAGYFSAARWLRVGLTLTGLLLVIPAMPHELSDVPLVAGWSLVTLAAIGLQRWSALERKGEPSFWQGLYVPAVIAALLAVLHLLAFELPLADLSAVDLPNRPFTDGGALAALILVATASIGSLVIRQAPVAHAGRISAFAIAAYLMPFEIQTAAVVVVWSGFAAGLILAGRSFPNYVAGYLAAAGALLGGGLLVTLYAVASPNRLVVREASAIDHPLFWSGATAALGAIIAALIFAAWLNREHRGAVIWAGALSAALGVYLLSVGVVDAFQSRVGEGSALGSLQKQAQVALSILWAVLGGGAFVAGILRLGAPVRLFGLALLTLATVKVFIVDLAALDTSYRVLSFIGLGILLLASSYMYQHYTSRPSRDEPEETASGAA